MSFSIGNALKLALMTSLMAPAYAQVGRASAKVEAIVCRVWQVDILYEESNEKTGVPSFDCIDGDKAYSLDAHDSPFLKSGAQVSLTGIKDDENAKILLSAGSSISSVNETRGLRKNSEPKSRRELVQAKGTSRVLVLRVNYRGTVPSLSKSELVGRVFGRGSHAEGTDMATQFSRCSFGKLKMKPFKAKDVEDGVANIKIQKRVPKLNVKVLQNLVYAEAKRRWSIGAIDHIMLVMPPGLAFDGSQYLAYAYLGSSISVFNDKFGGQLSALMHEIGHNLNLHHSGQGNDEYGDRTGYMGYGVPMVGGPNMCFNAQKFYSLGWMKDRSLRLDVEDLPWSGNIVPFVHYDLTAENQFVNLAVGGRRGKQIFLHYNLAESFNDGTQALPNRITVVTAVEHLGALKSSLVGSMDPSKDGLARYRNFENTGFDLVLRGCKGTKKGSLDLLRISAYLDDGKQSDTCKEQLVDPSKCKNAKATSKFFVDPKTGRKNCDWLKKNAKRDSSWPDLLCKTNHLAYHYCRATCGSC